MWNQAFKWSSQYHTTDPEKKPDIKPLSKEDFEFLEKAFESIMVNETKEFLECLEQLEKVPENPEDQEDEKFRLEMIEKMNGCIDGLEVSRNIVRCKKFKNVIIYLCNFWLTTSRSSCFQINWSHLRKKFNLKTY